MWHGRPRALELGQFRYFGFLNGRDARFTLFWIVFERYSYPAAQYVFSVVGRPAPKPKGQEDSAQGFNPGEPHPTSRRALKGRKGG
jgi:hypothetical protein